MSDRKLYCEYTTFEQNFHPLLLCPVGQQLGLRDDLLHDDLCKRGHAAAAVLLQPDDLEIQVHAAITLFPQTSQRKAESALL